MAGYRRLDVSTRFVEFPKESVHSCEVGGESLGYGMVI